MRDLIYDWLYGGSVALLFTLDRVLKTALLRGAGSDVLNIFPITVTSHINKSGALGIPFSNYIIALVSAVFIFFLIMYFFLSIEKRKMFRARSLLAVIAGSLSNVIDRVFIGGVVDYIAIHPALPVLNIADALIAGGLVSWFISLRGAKIK